MFRNYLIVAWRNIVKYRFYSVANILGLAVGILFLLLAGIYVWSETRINKNLRNAQNQYFLRSDWKDPNMGPDITTLAPLAKELKEQYPGLVANYYRWDGITSVVSKGDKHLRQGIQLGDSTLLSMYGFPLLYGDEQNALKAPFSVVVTRDLARTYFNRENVVGETITIQSFSGLKREFTITGVLKDMTENAVTLINTFNANQCFVPTNTLDYFGRMGFDNWANIYLPSYIELKPGVKPSDLEQPIKKLIAANTTDEIKRNLTVKLVNLGEEYYISRNNVAAKRLLNALLFTGFFILLMAMVNFINISTSSSAGRSREIGLRKVLGGSRKQVVIQFLTESSILAFFSMMLALLAYPLTQPVFENIIGKKMPSFSAFPAYFIALPLGFVLLIGILAGLYPALVLSSLKAVDSLKGKLKDIKAKSWVRQSLVGFQFTIAAVVLIAAIIVSQQVSKFFGNDLGYDKEYVVSSQVPRDWTPEGTRRMLQVRKEFAKLPEVKAVSLSYEIPDGMNGMDPLVYRAGTDSTRAISMQQLVTDAHYLETFQVAMKKGTYFTDTESDSSKVVINETAAKQLGFTDASEAIGQQLRVPGNPFVFTIKGVAADFHFNTLQQQMRPLLFLQSALVNNYRFLSFKLKPGNISEGIKAIETKWSTLLPGSSFEYVFMDQALEKMYTSELQLKKAAYVSTILALVMVLMGVLGMVSLSIQKRVKEIGVRKVLGASLSSIIVLFVKEFMAIILVAGFLACPLAYMLMNKWLSNYVYRVSITPFPFLVSIAAICLITLLLIIARSSKAALANPVKSLRSE